MNKFDLGSRILIKNNPPWPGRIVEHRGPLGPGGADVYRVRLDGGTEIEVREDQLEAVGGRDRTADLDTLADHVIRGINLNGPGGRSQLDFLSIRVPGDEMFVLGIKPEGYKGSPSGYSDAQYAYTDELIEALPGHIQARWSAFREAEDTRYPGDSQSESID